MTLKQEITETAKSHEFKITTIIFILLALCFNSWTVWSDGNAYFAITESIIKYQTLDLTKEFHDYNGIYMVSALQENPNRFASLYGFGAPLLNIPLYSIALATEKIFGIKIIYNNYSLLRTTAINLTSNILALLSILFSFTAIKKLKLKLNWQSMLCLAITTPLFFYSSIIPSFPHAADAFVLSLFVLLFIHFEKQKPREQIITGLILGFAVSVRYYNAFLLLAPLSYFALKKEWKKATLFTIGFLAFVWIIPLYWLSIMDTHGIEIAITESNNVTPNILPVHTLDILFNPIHGLLIWSPIVILSLFGLWLLWKEKQNKNIAILLAAMFLFLVLAYGRTEIWSAGWSYSARYLTGLFPVFAIGLAAFEKKFGKKAKIAITILTIYSIFLLLNFTLGFIHGETGTPIDMLQNWLSGKTTIKDFASALYKFTPADNIINFITKRF